MENETRPNCSHDDGQTSKKQRYVEGKGKSHRDKEPCNQNLNKFIKRKKILVFPTKHRITFQNHEKTQLKAKHLLLSQWGLKNENF